MSRRVFITGYGVITAIGNNAEENCTSLIHRRCGFGKLDFLETVHRDRLFACEVKLSDDALCRLAGVSIGAGYTRTTLLGLVAAKEAIAAAGLSDADVQHAGLISATTAGGIRELERHFYDLQDPGKKGAFVAYLDTADPGEHTERLAEYFHIKKCLGTVSNACSSAANAIILGDRLVAHGEIDCVICGGAEALSKVTINGFNALMILDREHCKPFDENRNGLNLGEGAAYIVLESEGSFQRSGRRAIAELAGYANVNEAFHQTASSPQGTGALEAMKRTLAKAGMDTADIDYINAHGTATENNDLSEGLAIQRLFGDRTPPFSSTKPYTGHTTSAAGSVEAAFCLMAFQQGCLFPNINFQQPMKELDIQPLTEVTHPVRLRNILSNSFGFGGSAASLLFAKC